MTELSEHTRSLEAWRERLATSLLRVCALLGGLMLLNLLRSGSGALMPPVLIGYGLAELGLIIAAVSPRIPHGARAGVLLALLYLIGTSSLWLAGLESNGRLFLLCMPPLALVLLGPRAGVVTLLLAMGTHAGCGWAICTGTVDFGAGDGFARDPTAWTRSLFACLTLSVVLMVPVNHLLKGQMFALEFAHKNRALSEARDAAESAVYAKTEFLATMSHELRTPMNGVLGMLQLLEQSELSEGQRELVRTARDSGGALLTVIGDILDFSKIEAGALEVIRAPVDLRDCVECSLDVVAPTAAAKGLTVGYWLEPGAPERIEGDAGRLRQILVNLLGNAVKFTDEGELRVVVSADGDRVRLAVSDTGAGIPPDRVELVFDPFRQVDGSITRKHGGTGLGLAICRSLAELMGGDIQVESVLNQGSTFTLTLPAGGEDLEQPAPAPDLSSSRVLLVTGSAVLARIVRAHLSPTGSDLCVVAPACAAARLATARWDAALLAPDADADALIALGEDTPLVGLRDLGGLCAPSSGLERTLTLPLKARRLWATLARLRAGDAQGAGVDMPALSEPHPLKILLVEDHPVNQQVATRMLRGLGYQVDVAGDGKAAVDAVLDPAGDGYDLLLMDCMMPVMDGIEATRIIRASLPPESQPRIVAMTANALEADLELCRQAGMDDVVTKPVERWALIEALLKTPIRRAA